jgi:predicted transcriptional regulator
MSVPLGEAELEVLKVLWDHGPMTVRQVHEKTESDGRKRAYTTVLTLLQRLLVKGAVAVDPAATAHVYRAAMTRDDLIRDRLATLADQLGDGTATPLVLALVQNHKFTGAEIERFRRLLDEQAEGVDDETPPRRPRRGRS